MSEKFCRFLRLPDLSTIGCLRAVVVVVLCSAGEFVFPIDAQELVVSNDGETSDSQRLASHLTRVLEAMQSLGYPIDDGIETKLRSVQSRSTAEELQFLFDRYCVATVTINPESRVKAEAGPASLTLQQWAYVPWLIKIVNQGAVKSPIQIESPQAGPSYRGAALLSMQRQDQLQLRANEAKPGSLPRFLHMEWHTQPPMTAIPSGAKVEYAILLVNSSESGQREATLEFSVGSGTQDLGFRAQLPFLMEILPAVPVRLSIHDDEGAPAFARLTIRDAAGRIYPPQPRRLAPDLFFQQQIYREHDEFVYLPPGNFEVECTQGPETVPLRKMMRVVSEVSNTWELEVRRWIHPMRYGWYCGDHHIHGAGCAHYTSPTEGVTPKDMFRQVAGEGLNVGCILTWGPCFEFQRQFFRPSIDHVSRRKTLLKYDIEVSGFGSQALGHVCLLNLRDQDFPGSDGTKEKGWPSWATPTLRWAKSQGAVTGYAHSGSGLQIDAKKAADRMFNKFDQNESGLISRSEATTCLLPTDFEYIDSDRDGGISRVEMQTALDTAADQLPNFAIPEMNSVGAMELPVSVAHGVCDFISTMDTARVSEWNMWYHVLNCGYPLKASGETDFPCMSGNAVGQGRVYVQLGKVDRLSFQDWCDGLASGRSYVSDGFVHCLEFSATHGELSAMVGDRLILDGPSDVKVKATIGVASQMPSSVAYATRQPEGGRRFIGDTVTLHGSRSNEWVATGERVVECVVNGRVVASQRVVGDGKLQSVEFDLKLEDSSWLAIRVFPSMHSNPIEAIVRQQPIRASKQSARWCIETIEQLWNQRERNIVSTEREQAREAFQFAINEFRKREAQSNEDRSGIAR
jgi:hypothetical protein